MGLSCGDRVALHPEGVDRNTYLRPPPEGGAVAPATPRAWLEIVRAILTIEVLMLVALHPEGVDRNDGGGENHVLLSQVALHPEGVDRNFLDG